MSGKILVVDDEHEIADLVELYLHNEDYEVFKFYSAKEALRCIEEVALDLAILDIMLPQIDGFEFCRKIREHHNYPVIMLTAKDEETDKITGLAIAKDIVELHGGEIHIDSSLGFTTFTVELPKGTASKQQTRP